MEKIQQKNTAPSRFKPEEVSANFLRHYCKVLYMPSGRPSDRYMNPITMQEARELTKDYSTNDYNDFVAHAKPFDNFPSNETEWRIWTALRIKYGFNYMTKVHDRYAGYREPIEPKDDSNEQLMCDIHNMIENRIEWHEEKHHLAKEEKIKDTQPINKAYFDWQK